MTTDTSQEQGPQVEDDPVLGGGAGRPARPHRPPVPPGGGAGAGAALPGGAARAGRSARTAGSWPRRRGSATPGACSACWTRRAGTRTRCATTCGPTSWSTWATRGRCWSWTRPGFLKKGTKSVGVQRQYSGTAGRTGEQPGRRLPGLRHPAGPGLPGPGAVPAQGLGRRRAAAGGGRGAAGGAVRDQAAAGPGDAPAGVRGRGAGGLGGGRHGLRHRPGAAAVAGGGAPRLRPGRALQAPGVDRAAAGDRPRGGGPAPRRGVGAALGRGGQPGPALVRLGLAPARPAPTRRGGGTGCWPGAA